MNTVRAQAKPEMRNIDLGGLIVDSETLRPIEGAKIYNENGEKLAVTNLEGYFKIKLNYLKKGEITFKLKVEKEEYAPLEQRELWGDREDNLIAAYYFGLKHKRSKSNPFSEMVTNIADVSLSIVNQNFENIKMALTFEEKIERAKNGNDKIYFEIDNGFYVVNESGWIKLNSKEDHISIDGKKVVLASQINSLIKRKNVKGMTPIVSDVASFRIDTRN